MDENSKLRTQAIKTQCNAAINILQRDNDSLRIVEQSLDQFTSNNELDSESFGELKGHMEDYKLIISAMRTANDQDISDYNDLKSWVGSEDIDGKEIIAQKKIAEEGINESEQAAKNCLSWAKWPFFSQLTVNSLKKQAEIYESLASYYQELYDECVRKEGVYDSVESNTSSLCVVGDMMRADIKSGIDTMGISGQYPAKGSPLWRRKLQDASISSTRRELLARGVTQKQLDNMESIGYMPSEIKGALDLCETEEDRQFFGYLMDGTAESYIKAFEINPHKLSESMTIIMADYAVHIVELDENGQSTKESEERLLAFNNALLQSRDYIVIAPEIKPTIEYRAAYLNKLCTGTEALAQADLITLASMEPGDEGYEELYANYKKVLSMKNLWLTEQDMLNTDDLNGTAKINMSEIKELHFHNNTVVFTYQDSDKLFGKPEEGIIRCELLSHGSALDNFEDRKALLELAQEREDAARKLLESLVIDVGIGALSIYSPPLAILAASVVSLAKMDASAMGSWEGLGNTNEEKLNWGTTSIIAKDVLDSYISFMNTTAQLEATEWEIAQEWFGMGGGYAVLDEEKNVVEMEYNFTGPYDPNVLRIMNKWENGGLGAWLPLEGVVETDGNKTPAETIWDDLKEDIEEEYIACSDEVQDTCKKLLFGSEGMFEEMNMDDFLDAVQVIKNYIDPYDIKIELASTVDDLEG